MKKVVAVECYADMLFFEKLLRNDQIIIKEKNKPEVFKGIKERSGGSFRVGIVDDDNEKIEKYLGDKIIDRISWKEYGLEIIQLDSKCHYVIQLSPNEFEDFLIKHLKENWNKELIDFGYTSVKEFKSESKSVYDKIRKASRLNNLFRFIFENYSENENSIHKLKRILVYLIEKNYQVEFNELKNV